MNPDINLKEKGNEKYVSFELGMISNYEYYTGIIFAGYTYGLGEPIVKGGRYDTLLSNFDKDAPAIGFAFVVDQLLTATSVKKQVAECAVPPKTRTGQGLQYIINQEQYLKVFLTDGDVPIDNSASERAIRTFCIGKKNWMFHNSANGASASALVYSISETAKLNNLRPYYYFKYILTELPKLSDEKGNIDSAKLDYLMPWSESLPEECRKPRRL